MFEYNLNMKKLEILHIVEALGGGVYSYFIDLSNYFGQSTTSKTTVIYSDKRPEIIPEKVKLDFHSNINLIKMEMKKGISFSDLFIIFKLVGYIKKIKPDIIHIHSSKMTVIGRLAYILSFSKANLYYTPHGYAFLKKDISKKESKIYFLVEKYFSKLGGVTIACGDTEYEYSKKFGKSDLIRNGININETEKHFHFKQNPILTIGILGRITYARNPKLFNLIAEKNPDIQFIWIGDGELRSIISAPNIKVTGWFMNREDGIKKLNDIDIYLQSSLWEGLPIAILEAMALKKPVVATNIIGNKDVVEHGETGYLFDSIEQLNLYIKQLKDKTHRDKLGVNGYHRVQELFNSEKNFSSLHALYEHYYNKY